MKLALVQLNPVVGDIKGNTAKIISYIKKARLQKADLVIFPELALLGYPPRDLLDLPYFIEEACQAVHDIAAQTKGLAVIVGGVEKNLGRHGKKIFNSAYWLENGSVRYCFRKSLLPFYDVFDESRYFEPAQTTGPIFFGGLKIAVNICEDLWVDPVLWEKNPYHQNPVAELVDAGTEMLINISASPYSINKFDLRQQIIQRVATENKMTVVYVNQVGGNDELVFDGGSMVMSPQGELGRAPFFKEGLTMVNTANTSCQSFKTPHSLALLQQALVTGLKDYVKKCGFKKVALGLSGGIDSALVAHLAVKALGKKNVTAVMMPSIFTGKESLDDAKKLALSLGIELKNISIREIQKSYLHTFKKMYGSQKPDATEENSQARIRGNLLMALSNKMGHLILSTGNKSELAVGYCTLYGDMCGALSVISDLPKTLVYDLAKFMNKNGKPIPENILVKAPTAELRKNQKDQDTLPPYEELDAIIKAFVEEGRSEKEIIQTGLDPVTVKKVIRMIKLNEYKRRQAAPGIKVTSKAFGMGRRFPIACRF